MNTTEVLENLRDEIDSAWSDNYGGFTDAVIKSLTADDPDLHCYLEMIATDRHTTAKARSLASQALQEVENDANFLARCGIDPKGWEVT